MNFGSALQAVRKKNNQTAIQSLFFVFIFPLLILRDIRAGRRVSAKKEFYAFSG
jgi:hypothetical protein